MAGTDNIDNIDSLLIIAYLMHLTRY